MLFRFVEERDRTVHRGELYKKIRTKKYDIETPSYLGPKLWNIVPNEYKTIESLADFKVKIKTWVPENCPCRLCKTYIHQVGFI